MKVAVGLVVLFVLVVFVPGSANAGADIGVKALGGRISYVSPENLDGTIGFGGLVDLGTFSPHVGMGASVDYWSTTVSSVEFRDIALGVSTRYLFKIENSKLQPYAGIGLAFHIINSKIPAVGNTPEATDTDSKFGIDFFGGTTIRVGQNVDLLGEVMYRSVSDVSQFMVSGGVLFRWGSSESR